MKKNKGFIATSLIYSFFLVFLAILAALIGSYIANKMILTRFNEDAMDDLNNYTHTITIYAKNVGVKDGYTLTNLIGDLSNTSLWRTTADFTFEEENGKSVLKKNSHIVGSYLDRKIDLNSGKYYFSLEYKDPNASLTSYINDQYLNAQISDPSDSYTRHSKIIDLNSGEVTMTIGNSTQNKSGESYIKNVMLINLSIPFGNSSPSKEWLDENLSWFDNNIGYRVIERVKKDEETKVEFVYNTEIEEFTKKTVSCKTDTNGVFSDFTFANDTLTLKNVDKNIVCNVDYNNEETS